MRTLVLLCLLAAPAPAREVTVRLYWLHPPSSVRVNGREFRGSRVAPARIGGALRLEVPGSPALSLEGPLDIRARNGTLRLTLRLPLEQYVAAVLAGESSVFNSEEALKAMAVTARTYAVRYLGRHKAEGFDFCDTTHCQDLRLAAVSERLRAAADATESELLWYEGSPAAAFYCRHCGGMSEAAEIVWPEIRAPYLRQQADSFCLAAGRAEWRSQVNEQELGGPVAILSRTPSGRVAEVRVGSRRMSATAFQLAVGRTLGWEIVRSNFFDLIDDGRRVTFHGFGAGHGVGLCQTGAEQRGERGHTYRQILAFYFPGTSLGVSARGFSWTRLQGERVEVYSTRPNEDGFAVAPADRALREAEARSGIQTGARPRLKIYPTVAAFRDATGQSGRVAASTLGRTIRMQPVGLLRSAGTLDATLLHEMLHVVLEGVAHPSVPAWFREDLASYLAGAGGGAARVLVDRYGRATVMRWLRTGSGALARPVPATPPPR